MFTEIFGEKISPFGEVLSLRAAVSICSISGFATGKKSI